MTVSILVTFRHSVMHIFHPHIVPMGHQLLLTYTLSLSDGQPWMVARGDRVQAKTPALLGR